MKRLFVIIILAVWLLTSVSAFAGNIPEGAYIFDDFTVTRGMNTNDKPADNGYGLTCWWHNFNSGEVQNKKCSLENGILKVVYGFDKEGDEVFTWGNWGEAFAVPCTDSTGTKGDPNCVDYKYFNITIKGEVGGEEKILIFNPAPEDEDSYSCYFDELVLADGSHPKITKGWQTLKIDLAASKMPQVFNRFHIRAIKADTTIYLDELYWTVPDGTGKKPVPNQNFTKLASKIDARVAAFEAGPATTTTTTAAANPKTGDNSIVYIAIILLTAAVGYTVIRKVKAENN